MIVTNGDGIVAALATTASNTVLGLVNAAGEGASYGYSALVRGWLFPGQPVDDVGTTSDTDALVGDSPISGGGLLQPGGADRSRSATAVAPTAGTHFAYIPNPNSGASPNPELNGLRQIIGNGALGGLNSGDRRAGVLAWRVPGYDDDDVLPGPAAESAALHPAELQRARLGRMDWLPAAGELLFVCFSRR
jgi:hypothetical protein